MSPPTGTENIQIRVFSTGRVDMTFQYPILKAYPFPLPPETTTCFPPQDEIEKTLYSPEKTEEMYTKMQPPDLNMDSQPYFPSHLLKPHCSTTQPSGSVSSIPHPKVSTPDWFFTSPFVVASLSHYPSTLSLAQWVIPGVFVSGLGAALNADFLAEHNVTHVLTLGPSMPPAFSGKLMNKSLESRPLQQAYLRLSYPPLPPHVMLNPRNPPPRTPQPPALTYRVVPRVRAQPPGAWWRCVPALCGAVCSSPTTLPPPSYSSADPDASLATPVCPHVGWWLSLFDSAVPFALLALTTQTTSDAGAVRAPPALLVHSFHGAARAQLVTAALLCALGWSPAVATGMVSAARPVSERADVTTSDPSRHDARSPGTPSTAPLDDATIARAAAVNWPAGRAAVCLWWLRVRQCGVSALISAPDRSARDPMRPMEAHVDSADSRAPASSSTSSSLCTITAFSSYNPLVRISCTLRDQLYLIRRRNWQAVLKTLQYEPATLWVWSMILAFIFLFVWVCLFGSSLMRLAEQWAREAYARGQSGRAKRIARLMSINNQT